MFEHGEKVQIKGRAIEWFAYYVGPTTDPELVAVEGLDGVLWKIQAVDIRKIPQPSPDPLRAAIEGLDDPYVIGPCQAGYEQARRDILALPEWSARQTGWPEMQPMETAPKGPDILVLFPEIGPLVASWIGGYWRAVVGSHRADFYGPIGWWPLPTVSPKDGKG